MSNFEKIKFRVKNARECELIQKELFHLGYSWFFGGQEVQDYESSDIGYLYGEPNGRILKDADTTSNLNNFENVYTDYKEMEVVESVSFKEVDKPFSVDGKAMTLAQVKQYIKNLEEEG